MKILLRTALIILSTVVTWNSASAVPVTFDVTAAGNGTGNSGVLLNELDATLSALGLNIALNPAITGTIDADLIYNAGVLESVQFLSADLSVASASDSDSFSIPFPPISAGISVSLTGIGADVVSSIPELATPDGGFGGMFSVEDTTITLDEGNAVVSGSGLAASLNENIDFSTDQAVLPLAGLGLTGSLSVDPGLLGTISLSLQQDIGDFLDQIGVEVPIDVEGDFALNVTGIGNVAVAIPEPNSGLLLASLA